MTKYNVDVESAAVLQALYNMGFKKPQYVHLVGARTYRHTAKNGTVREFRVYNTNEYFDAVRKGEVDQYQPLHRAVTKYIVETVIERNGIPVGKTEYFYTLDPEYTRYNGQSFEILRRSKHDLCREIRLACGDVIIAFRDETDGFIREHENDPIQIPVNWEMSGYVKFPCRSIAEALEQFWEQKNDLPLPKDGDYLEDSFQLSTEDADTIATYNHPFRDPNRVRTIDEGEVNE